MREQKIGITLLKEKNTFRRED